MTHPLLPCGYNSWENNGDEVDSPGVNEPIWPVYGDTFEALPVLVITPVMLEAFETECPDLVVPRETDTVVIQPQPDKLIIRKVA